MLHWQLEERLTSIDSIFPDQESTDKRPCLGAEPIMSFIASAACVAAISPTTGGNTPLLLDEGTSTAVAIEGKAHLKQGVSPGTIVIDKPEVSETAPKTKGMPV